MLVSTEHTIQFSATFFLLYLCFYLNKNLTDCNYFSVSWFCYVTFLINMNKRIDAEYILFLYCVSYVLHTAIHTHICVPMDMCVMYAHQTEIQVLAKCRGFFFRYLQYVKYFDPPQVDYFNIALCSYKFV